MVTDALTITHAEIMDALAAASTAPEGAATVAELVATTGYAEKRVRDALRSFAAAGRLGVHRVIRTGIDGRQTPVPAYTVKPAPRAGKRTR